MDFPMNPEQFSITDCGFTLQVKWNQNHIAKFNVKWLRFHCNCDRCWRPFIGMYPLDKAAFDDDIVITKFWIENNSLYVDINKDIFENHSTYITLKWLKKYCSCNGCLNVEIRRREMIFYDPASTTLPSVEYDPYMNDGTDRTVYKCVKNVMEYGFSFIRNIPEHEPNIVLEIATKIGAVMDSAYGKVFDVRVRPNAKITSGTNIGLFLHQDGTYYEVSPGVQLFHAYRFDDCVKGGESILKDIFQVAEKLREEYPEEFKTLTQVPVVYETKRMKEKIPSFYEHMKTHIEVDYNDQIVSVHWNPGIEGIMRIREEDMSRYYKAYKEFDRMLKRDENQYKVRLRTGDLLIFNNHRMAHSREAFELNGGDRHFRSCYINMDDLKSRYCTLADKFGEDYVPTKIGNRSVL